MIKVEDLNTKFNDAIERLIRAHGFRPSEVDDIKQDLFVAWIEGGYEKIYDPTRSAQTTFVYNFVSLRLKGYRSKKKRDPLARAVPLVTDLDSGRGILVDLVEGTPEVAPVAEEKVDEEGLIEELKRRVYPGYAGHTRDYHQVYVWLKEGKTQTEIAALMGYSLGSTNAMVKVVRELTKQHTFKVEPTDPLDLPKKEEKGEEPR